MFRSLTASLMLVAIILPASGIIARPQESKRLLERAVRLEREAERDREVARKTLERAAGYTKLAEDARSTAAGITNPVAKEVWTNTARRHDAEARRLQEQAAALDKRADQTQATARQLREDADRLPRPEPSPPALPPTLPPAPSPSNGTASSKEEDPASAIKIEDLVGRWRSKEDGQVISIEQPYQNQNELAFLGVNSWEGSFDAKTGRLKFSRPPDFDQMSLRAPEWARKGVTGKLKWTMELEAKGDCSEIVLKGKWYPGEIEWREEKEPQTGRILKRVAAVGAEKGAAVDVEYEREAKQTTLNFSSGPSLVVWPNRSRSFADYFLPSESLDSISKTQPFVVLVRMPRSLADAKGETITVTFRSTKTGSTAAVRLARHPSSGGITVYTTNEPLAIADPGSGVDDIRLRAENEDRVVVSYEGGRTDFTVWNSTVQQGIAANEEAFRAMLALYNSIIRESSDRKVREAASQKMLMINNARHIINDYQPKPLPPLYVDLTGTLKTWEKITDYMRLAVGQRYLTLLERPTVNSPRPSAQARDQFYKELGITLTSVDEWDTLIEAFEEGRQKFRDQFWGEFTPQFAMGLFQVVAVTNQIANPLFQTAEQFAILVYGVDFYGEPVDKTERIFAGIGLASRLVLGAANARSLSAFNNRFSTPQRLRTGSVRATNKFRAGEKPRMLRPEILKPVNQNESFYAKAEKVAYPPDKVWTPLQGRPDTCQLMVNNGFLKEVGLQAVPEDLSVAYAQAIKVYTTGKGATAIASIKYLKDLGVKSSVAPSNLNAIEFALKRGLGVSVGAQRHAIRVLRIERVAGGRKIVFFEDPWNGNVWRMNADDFCQIVDKDGRGAFADVLFVDLKGSRADILNLR